MDMFGILLMIKHFLKSLEDIEKTVEQVWKDLLLQDL